MKTSKFPDVHSGFGCGFLSVTECSSVKYKGIKDLEPLEKKSVKKMEKNLKKMSVLSEEEAISGIFEEDGIPNDIFQTLYSLLEERDEVKKDRSFVDIHTRELYQEVTSVITSLQTEMVQEAAVFTKYKTVAKKVKPVATQLPLDTEEHIKQAEKEPSLRETRKIGHTFTNESLANLKI